MRPSDEGVEEFRRIFRDVFKKDISSDAAREMATRILTLYELLARPLQEGAGNCYGGEADQTLPGA
jgi:hypothetical protein